MTNLSALGLNTKVRATIAGQRLINQRLVGSGCRNPAEVVAHMGAIQGQDYDGGIWSIGLRLPGSRKADVEKAIADRTVIRTWAMRGTLHFVEAGNVRRTLELLSKGIIARTSAIYCRLGLDSKTLTRCENILTKALEGGQQLTRGELVSILEGRGVRCHGMRATFILHRASIDRLICFGVKREKQFTHALFDEWVKKTRPLSSEESLSKLTLQYFASHGPATVQDFMWWSGLSVGQVRSGIEMVKSNLGVIEYDGAKYWMTAGGGPEGTSRQGVLLLPGFDDFLLGYKDRSASLDPKYSRRLANGGVLKPAIVMDGNVIGTWRRTITKGKTTIQTHTFSPLDRRQKEALAAAEEQYIRFIGQ